MTLYCVAFGLLTVLVTLLLRAEFAENQNHIYFFKPLSTLLVIFIALLPTISGQIVSGIYLYLIIGGLIFSLGGDISLMDKSKKAFTIGLVLFLITHIIYSIAFSIAGKFSQRDLTSAVILFVLASAAYAYLYRGLGRMKIPVLFYIIIITVMMNRALSCLYNDSFSQNRAVLIATGAGLFYISDLILAINKFHHPLRYHRINLAFYYLGQLLIASSTRM